jgi:hypothetical protein
MVDSVGKRRLVTSVIIQRGEGVLRGRSEGVVILTIHMQGDREAAEKIC